MLASKLYAPTLRDDPAEADVASHKLMLKAGMLRKMQPDCIRSCRWAVRFALRLKTLFVRK